jgi:hypothetical protein
MSIALVTTRGFGNGTLIGSITKIVTIGFNTSTVIPSVIPISNGIATSGVFGYSKVSRGSL